MFCSQNERTQELSRRKKPKRIRIGEEKEEIVHFFLVNRARSF